MEKQPTWSQKLQHSFVKMLVATKARRNSLDTMGEGMSKCRQGSANNEDLLKISVYLTSVRQMFFNLLQQNT